jgi:hypothetical protein
MTFSATSNVSADNTSSEKRLVILSEKGVLYPGINLTEATSKP